MAQQYELRIRQRYGNNQDFIPVGRWDLKRDAAAASQSYPADVYDVEVASASDAAPESEPEAPAAPPSEIEQLRAQLAAAEAANARKDAELAAVRAATEQQQAAPASEPTPAERPAGEQPNDAEPKGL